MPQWVAASLAIPLHCIAKWFYLLACSRSSKNLFIYRQLDIFWEERLFNKSRQSWRRQISIKYVLGCSSYLPNQNNTLWNFYLQKSWTNFVQYIEDVTNIMICSENWPSLTPFKNPNRLLGKIPSQFCF